MENSVSSQPPVPSTKFNIPLDLRWVCLALLVVIAAMLIIWKPWSPAADANSRVVEVTGEAILTAEPDEYKFYPNYQYDNADKQTSINEAAAKSKEIVAKLKSLGLRDGQIKVDASGYDTLYRAMPESTETTTYTLSFIITASSREQADKVQEYLLTTTPTGGVAPQASFSEAKRKELERKARDEATKDARAKADQSASNLGFKVHAVKSVKDGQGFGDVIPLGAAEMRLGTDKNSAVSNTLPVQPGDEELRYDVTVTYYIR